MISPRTARLVAAPILLGAGVMSLPVAALVLDRGPGTENLILPAQLGGMAVLGGVLGAAMPSIAGAGASRGRGGVVGAVAGLGAGIVGAATLWKLETG